MMESEEEKMKWYHYIMPTTLAVFFIVALIYDDNKKVLSQYSLWTLVVMILTFLAIYFNQG